MTQAPNFFAFLDLALDSRFLWVSPSVYDALGYEPEELVGMNGYDIVYPDDHEQGKEFHKQSFVHDLVAAQIVARCKAKDGRAVLCLCVISLCYDFSISCVTVLDHSAEAYLQQRAYSSVMTRRVGSKKEEFARMKRHHDAFAEKTWDHSMLEPEPRVCLIINRYTRDLTVMYASSACEKVLCVDPDDLTGKPILIYIRADELAPFVEQVDLIKTTTAISQMRFWFQSPNCQQEIPCEAIISGSTDGIVAVVRRCKPFVRKHLIGSWEQFESYTRGSSPWSSRRNQAYGSSPVSETSGSTPSSYGSYASKSTSSFRHVTRATLNRIKIFELDDEKDGYIDDDALEVPAFKEVIVQDYDDEDDDDEDRDDVDTVVRGVAVSRLDDNGMEF
ncbi:MAG: hypothetical protein J3Q66DRAFT_327161 [Benniella sp.]|nr:MAG: hypothetical protein J3Q66DRAFT_327161 [Benniella sp.]